MALVSSRALCYYHYYSTTTTTTTTTTTSHICSSRCGTTRLLLPHLLLVSSCRVPTVYCGANASRVEYISHETSISHLLLSHNERSGRVVVGGSSSGRRAVSILSWHIIHVLQSSSVSNAVHA